MKAAYPKDEIENWCGDEARFGLQPVLRRVWAPRGERPLARVAPDYEWLWMHATAHPQTGKSFWLSLPRLDTEMVQMFLDEFAKEHAVEGKRIILCWDGAPAHRAKSLRVPERITIVQTLPYTPELNPAEQLWPLVKEGVANKCFKDLDAVEERVCNRVRNNLRRSATDFITTELPLVAELIIYLIMSCKSVLLFPIPHSLFTSSSENPISLF